IASAGPDPEVDAGRILPGHRRLYFHATNEDWIRLIAVGKTIPKRIEKVAAHLLRHVVATEIVLGKDVISPITPEQVAQRFAGHNDQKSHRVNGLLLRDLQHPSKVDLEE